MILNLIFIGLIYFSRNQLVETISCLTFEGEKRILHDWVAVYKPPFGYSMNGMYSSSNIQGYYYKTSSDKTNDFLSSAKNIFGHNSIINSILIPFYQPDIKGEFSYILYNDVIPQGTTASSLSPKETHNKYGAGKGVLIWDDRNAIWIQHSVPAFPPPITNTPKGNQYVSKGHLFLCLTIPTTTLTTIMKTLIISRVKVYDKFFHDKSQFRKLEFARNNIYREVPNNIPSIYRTRSLSNSDLTSIRSQRSFDKTIKRSRSLPELRPVKMDPNAITQFSVSPLLKTYAGETFKVIAYSFKETSGYFNKVANNLANSGPYLSHILNGPVNIFLKSALYSPSFISEFRTLTKSQGCSSNTNNNLIDILDIKIHTSQWDTSRDESKWMVAKNLDWFCITDLDRKSKDKPKDIPKRVAGISLCLHNRNLKEAFGSIIHRHSCSSAGDP